MKLMPIFLENITNRTISFSVESASCDSGSHTLAPDEFAEIQCPTTNGDNWYNLYFDDDGYGLKGGSLTVFEFVAEGRIKPVDYTDKIRK